MDGKQRCQSCGMPLMEGNYGTERGGAPARDWCMFCYTDGAFTDPHLTLAGMLERSVTHMMGELRFSREKATALAQDVIPGLRRWHTPA
ncbi:MAG TPA: zinc ribbon domain-containing protein [bacterium]